MSVLQNSNAVAVDFNKNDKADLLIQMLDKINKKTKDLTESLYKQGVLTKDQMPDIKSIRLAGNKSMKKRVRHLVEEADDLI